MTWHDEKCGNCIYFMSELEDCEIHRKRPHSFDIRATDSCCIDYARDEK
jgi:hypothetical protein